MIFKNRNPTGPNLTNVESFHLLIWDIMKMVHTVWPTRGGLSGKINKYLKSTTFVQVTSYSQV